MNVLRRIDRFCLGMAVALDNITVDLCRVSGRSIPASVYLRRRKWQDVR